MKIEDRLNKLMLEGIAWGKNTYRRPEPKVDSKETEAFNELRKLPEFKNITNEQIKLAIKVAKRYLS